MNRVVVVGAAGFIGRALMLKLKSLRIPAIGIVRRPPESAFPFEFLEIHDYQSADFQKLLQPDTTVVLAAGGAKPGDSQSSSFLELKENFVPMLGILDATKRCENLHFVFISSAGTVYGNQECSLSESSQLLPNSYHGAAKIAAESFLHAHCHLFSHRATVLRMSNVYGPEQPLKGNFGFVRKLLSRVSNGEEIEVWGDGQIRRDFLYIDDAVSAIVSSIQHSPAVYQNYNVARGISDSLRDVIDAAAIVSGLDIKTCYLTQRRIDALSVEFDVSMIKDQLGWAAEVNLIEGVKRTWVWLQTIKDR